jgi:hypothetical protein
MDEIDVMIENQLPDNEPDPATKWIPDQDQTEQEFIKDAHLTISAGEPIDDWWVEQGIFND